MYIETVPQNRFGRHLGPCFTANYNLRFDGAGASSSSTLKARLLRVKLQGQSVGRSVNTQLRRASSFSSAAEEEAVPGAAPVLSDPVEASAASEAGRNCTPARSRRCAQGRQRWPAMPALREAVQLQGLRKALQTCPWNSPCAWKKRSPWLPVQSPPLVANACRKWCWSQCHQQGPAHRSVLLGVYYPKVLPTCNVNFGACNLV